MISHTVEIRVRFSETDKMQFLHNVKYIEYFEVARTELLRHYGLPYKEIENNGYEMPVTQTFIKYKAPAFYDELLLIEASVKELYSVRVHIDYRIFRKENNLLLAEGYNELAFIKTATKKAVRPPEFYIKAINKYFEKQHAQ